MRSTDPLTVSEVAARSGFSPSALRFYEREGLIEATRTSGNQRRYQRSVLRRLAFIRAQQTSDQEKRRRADVLVPSGLGRAVTWRRLAGLARAQFDIGGAAEHMLQGRVIGE